MSHLKLLFLVLLVASWGCAQFPGMSSTSQQEATTPAPSSFLYDFKDVRVPEEMEIIPDKSSITPGDGSSSGVMLFKGRVEPASLYDFFFNTMPRDGWTLLTYQKYQRYLLVFSKDTRLCVITIQKTLVNSVSLEVWVSPRAATSFAPAYNTGSTPPLDSLPPEAPNAERTLTQ